MIKIHSFKKHETNEKKQKEKKQPSRELDALIDFKINVKQKNKYPYKYVDSLLV